VVYRQANAHKKHVDKTKKLPEIARKIKRKATEVPQ
jgi:hypothetical protein